MSDATIPAPFWSFPTLAALVAGATTNRGAQVGDGGWVTTPGFQQGLYQAVAPGVGLTLEWERQSRRSGRISPSFSFSSLLGGLESFFGGGRLFGATDSDFVVPVTLGTPLNTYAAHAFIVCDTHPGGADTVVRVSGTTITDTGIRTPGATVDITIPSGTPANTYRETRAKWLGTTTWTHISGPAVNCNYGIIKYWDGNNLKFVVRGFDVTFEATVGGTVDVRLYKHAPVGWTFVSGGPPLPPPAVHSLAADHGPDVGLTPQELYAWERVGLSLSVDGSAQEGIYWELLTSVANAVSIGNAIMLIS